MFEPNMLGLKQRTWIYFSYLMGSETLSEPNTLMIFFFKTSRESLSIFYQSSRIILSGIRLKISQEWNYTLVFLLHKMTKFIDHKYIMNPSNFKSMISLFLKLSHIYILMSIFLKYNCTFSLYKLLIEALESPYIHQTKLFTSTNY
jgi:hypothetical protein